MISDEIECHYGLFSDIIPAFVWKDWEDKWKLLEYLVCWLKFIPWTTKSRHTSGNKYSAARKKSAFSWGTEQSFNTRSQCRHEPDTSKMPVNIIWRSLFSCFISLFFFVFVLSLFWALFFITISHYQFSWYSSINKLPRMSVGVSQLLTYGFIIFLFSPFITCIYPLVCHNLRTGKPQRCGSMMQVR